MNGDIKLGYTKTDSEGGPITNTLVGAFNPCLVPGILNTYGDFDEAILVPENYSYTNPDCFSNG